uniref:Metallothionein n=1 Tax=Pisolithus albus TaxID=178870 RepID=A0A0C5DYX6_9AGAM|nr:metallothionein [Pisolithus albus]
MQSVNAVLVNNNGNCGSAACACGSNCACKPGECKC